MTVKCPECGHELEIMYEETLEYRLPDVKFDIWEYEHKSYIGHCKKCLSDWEWEEWYQFGYYTISELKRKFWG